MTCPHCGTDTRPETPTCDACGAFLTNASNVTLGPSDDLTSATTAPPHNAIDVGPSPDETVQSTGAGPTSTIGPGQTFGSRYHVIRLLGAGGMGAVYHAWDAELGVAVALKVIRTDIAGDPDAGPEIERQFKRELLLARQVTHKHVVRIHDLGDIAGVKYITMPYVKGADLATMLRREGKLSIPRTLNYLRQIVDGLVAAHEAGVVHRDLKPANIMIDEEDQALIMDFGIARSSTSSRSGASKVVGTLAYMAPEQAQAKTTDQRADVYALGMMAREMLVGRTGRDSQQAVAELMQRIREAPPRIRAIDPLIPEPLDALIARCVEPDAANRFQKSAQLAQALANLDENGHFLPAAPTPVASPWRLITAAGVIVATIGVATVFIRRAGPTVSPKAIDPVSILVADFDNKTGDAVFDGALEQPLTIAMEGASFITSVPRQDALKIAKTQAVGSGTKLDAQSARLVAFREGIKFVLAGSVASGGGKFQLRLDAVDPVDGKVVKSATATATDKGDVLNAVGSLASKIRTDLGDKTAAGNEQLAAMETFTAGSIDAMREYSIAQDLQNVGGRSEEALAHYEKAIELDPKFGRALAGAANINFRLGRQAEGEALFKKALTFMDRMTDREKHRTLGSYYAQVSGNYEKCVEEYVALVKAYPADAGGHSNLAVCYFYLLDFKKALDEGKRAVDAYPKDLTARNNMALFAMYAGDFAGATALGKAVVADSPTVFKAYLPIAVEAVLARGDVAGAGKVYDDMAKSGATGASAASLGRADVALYSGRWDAAIAELKSGIAADMVAKNGALAAFKYIAIADAELTAGRRAQAADAAHEAMKRTRRLETIVPAARVLIHAGKAAEARALAAELEGQLPKQNRAYGKILLAEIALEDGKTADAIDLLTQARQLADVWLGRFELGMTYLQANAFAEAVTEFETCEKRRGEATALFLDDRPTLRYLAALPYWIGRAQEGLNMTAPARTRYENFLNLRKDAVGDPLGADARRRLATM